MNFFQTLFQTMTPGVDYNLTVSRTDAEITVMVMPKVNGLKDQAAVHITPFTMCAQPHIVDNAFFIRLTEPLKKAADVLCNMSRFEQQTQQAAANSKVNKAQKEQNDKDAKAKKEKYDKFMKQAGEHETAGKLQDAILSLQQARLHGTEKEVKKADEKISELKAKQGQGSLFEVEPQDIPATAPVEQAPQQTPPEMQQSQQQVQPSEQQPTHSTVHSQQAQPVPPSSQQQGYYGQQPPQQAYPGQMLFMGYPGQQMPQQGMRGQNYGQPNQGGYPQNAGFAQGQPLPPNYQQGQPYQGYNQQPPASYPNNESFCRPGEYIDIEDAEFTHVGQTMPQQPQP